MRPFLDGPRAVAAVAIVGGSAPADSASTLVHKARAEGSAPSHSVACLGGMLNERDASDYFTAADYPAFAALTAGVRRIFICGDSIPSILPSSARAGFVSRRR
jgi:hypothetical protein